MEAFGFMRAVRAEKLSHALVIRGVSDLIKGKASADEQGNQPIAAANASDFLFAIIDKMAEALHPKKTRWWHPKSDDFDIEKD